MGKAGPHRDDGVVKLVEKRHRRDGFRVDLRGNYKIEHPKQLIDQLEQCHGQTDRKNCLGDISL